jgi:DNA invertase Pin-like site-specific DNA recombinase
MKSGAGDHWLLPRLWVLAGHPAVDPGSFEFPRPGRLAVWPPQRHLDQAGLDQIPAVEERGNLGAGPQGHRGGGVVVHGGRLLGRGRPEVPGSVRQGQVAARGKRVAEDGQDVRGVLPFGDEVQDRDEQQRHRPGEVDERADFGVGQDGLGVAQFGQHDVGGAAARQQRVGVHVHDRVVDIRVVCTRTQQPGRINPMSLGAGFVRVSTGSQDETSQVKIITEESEQRGITIVKWFKLHGYSASKGEQEPALREAIADIERGAYSLLVVTESRSLDRREDLDAQAEILLAIRRAGGDVISIAEPQFGKTDFAGRVVTLVAQHANAEKSRIVKATTYRGIMMIRDNKAYHGPLPGFWATKGVRYAKQAYCEYPAAVIDIYERAADGESIASIGRVYDLYPNSVRNIIRFAANHTGVIECSYTHEGQTETWVHEVTPVVDSPLWWRANKALDANKTDARGNKGGRPVASPANWISGILDCPECGGKLFVNGGLTPGKNWRTGKPRVQRPRIPKLRCSGTARQRISCGDFKGIDAQPVIDLITGMFASDTTDILAFQRVAGNAHELDALRASVAKLQARLSVTEDDDELDVLVAERKSVKARIEGFQIIPDSFDYAPTGQTVAGMWSGDDTVKRTMVKAVKDSWGLALAEHDGQWGIKIGTDFSDTGSADGIVDLGNGLCFRRDTR